MTSHTDIAQALVTAIELGDADGIAALYADSVAIWHNFDDKTQSRAENLGTLAGFIKTISNRKYTEIRCQETATGFVQQHVLTGTFQDGRLLNMPCCLIVEVVDGKITRLDEYLDPSPFSR